MEKLTPEQYLKQKTEAVPGKKISPEEYLAQKNTIKDTRIATEKVQTPEEYLANKQKTTTVPKSTLSKVGDFVKPIAQDIYKTAATIPVRATQAGAAIVGQATTNPALKKKAFEYASEPVNIGFGTQVKPLDTSSIGRAAQQTAGDILKTASLTNIGGRLTLAKQAALQGGAYGLGNAMSEGKSASDTIKDTAIGTVGGLVLGKGLSVLGGAKTASKLSKRTEEQITNEALARANFGPIPEASSPRLSLPAPRKTNEIPIQLPSPGILKGQQLLRESGPTVPTEPTITTKKSAGKVKKDVAQNTGKIQETVPVKTPEVVPSVPKPISYTKDPVQSLTKVMETELPPNTDPTFIGTTLADQTAKYDAAASVISTDNLIDMAMGLKASPAGLNPVSIHTLTSIRKDLTVEQAMRLKNIYPLSQAGQDLSLARLKSGAVIDNPVNMMQAVEKELKEQVIKKGVNKNDIKNLFPDCGFN